ncbi:hypothetical protein EIN_475390 [Entamoeba invadens IP1]|uniref:DDE-1 domain-containing protein n=1 Tax=Entamoeba invadens IP1 TaxID=370355 RepID=A0A0A1U773_ENTIV|nr:hypothetical protein EIN_475390 [Entamoeba invadens IP1]ELP88857.1 hypothetical protein EIN_475390 [Entamoeba invadens IP1]|eukprot:XP_004255628.1 hypothetical protein EIN_475390 [Entamoeba invadens IP1]
MDNERAELSKDELRSYETRAVDLLNNDKQYAGERVVHLNGVKPSLLINMDESDYCPFVDSKRSNFYVDDNYDYTNSYSVDRSQKRITLIAGIFTNNTTLKPMIILSNLTMKNEINRYTDRDEIAYQRKSFITEDIYML